MTSDYVAAILGGSATLLVCLAAGFLIGSSDPRTEFREVVHMLWVFPLGTFLIMLPIVSGIWLASRFR